MRPRSTGGFAGEISPAQATRLLDELEPVGAVAAARHDLAMELVADLVRLDDQRREAQPRITAAVTASKTTVTELFGVGPIVAATVIGDVGDIARFPSRDHFAAYNGTAPIEVSSGGRRKVFRLSRRGNRRLNHAIHMAAVTQIRHRHSDGRAYYDRKIAEGHTGKEAIRALKRRISDAIYTPAPRRRRTGSGDTRAREGNRGTTLSPARPAHTPNTGSSAKPLPDPPPPPPAPPPRGGRRPGPARGGGEGGKARGGGGGRGAGGGAGGGGWGGARGGGERWCPGPAAEGGGSGAARWGGAGGGGAPTPTGEGESHDPPPSEALRSALTLRDLADTAQGPHAIQLITMKWWRRWRRTGRRSTSSVAIEWSPRRITTTISATSRRRSPASARTRSTSTATTCCSHTSGTDPTGAAQAGSVRDDDVLVVAAGVCYRRDSIDWQHTGNPHQLDLWRIHRSDGRLTEDDLVTMIDTMVDAALPAPSGARFLLPIRTPTTAARSTRWNGRWIEIGECGLAAAHVLRRAGLDDTWTGLAMGTGLDRLLMMRKGIPDIRLLRSKDPRIAGQMLDLAPYRPVSLMPPVRRDVSVAVGVDVEGDHEAVGDRIRGRSELTPP